jgi:hypothetical protein
MNRRIQSTKPGPCGCGSAAPDDAAEADRAASVGSEPQPDSDVRPCRVFLRWGRAPLCNPHRLQGIASLAEAPAVI